MRFSLFVGNRDESSGQKRFYLRIAYRKDGHAVMEHATAHRLAQEIRQSEEYQTYHALKEEVMADETTAALLKEYKKLQLRLQMAAVSGTQPDNDDMQRFQGISALLFGKLEVSQYLLAEMRLQQEVAGILRIITDAADIDMGMGQ